MKRIQDLLRLAKTAKRWVAKFFFFHGG